MAEQAVVDTPTTVNAEPTLLLPLEPKSPEPEDELLHELLPRLSEEDERDLYQHLDTFITDALNDRAEWESRLAHDEDQYLGKLPDKTMPWKGAANFNVPITMLGVETLKPRLTESVAGSDPAIFAKPIEGTDVERSDLTQLYLNWQVDTELNLRPVITESAHLFLTPGTVIAKIWWKHDRRSVRAIRTFPATMPLQEILAGLLDSPVKELEHLGNLEWKGELKRSGSAPQPIRIKARVIGDAIQILLEKEEIITDRPQVDLIPPEDFIAPANSHADPNQLPRCAHRLWLTEDQIRRKVTLGAFYKDVANLLLQQPTDGDQTQIDAVEVREQRAESQGVEPFGPSSARAEPYEIFECYLRWDIDADGFEEEIIAWICREVPGRLLAWDYLDNIYAHGMRPFAVGRYMPMPFRFYGLSFPQIVQNIQDEINTIHNQRVDCGTVQNWPFYFYRATITNNLTRRAIRPGEGIPIDDPQRDINMPRWQGSPAFGNAEEALLYQIFERLTGITDLTLGRQPNRVGATRTASGTASLLAEAGLRFKVSMEAFQEFWRQVFQHILALDQQYLPPGKEFRVTGHWPEVIRIEDRAAIRGKFDLRLTTTTETMNKAVLREDATARLQVTLNPLVLQSGNIGQRGFRKVLRDYYKAFGDVDPDTTTLEPIQGDFPRTPEEELAIWRSGGTVRPSPAENIGQHLQIHMQQRQDPLLLAALGPEGRKQLDAHIAETIQLAQTMMMAQSAQGGKTPMVGSNAMVGRQAPQAMMGGAQQPTPGAMAGPGGGMNAGNQ